MIQCLHWSRSLNPTPSVYSATIPFIKAQGINYTLPSFLRLDLKQEVPCLCTNVKIRLTLQKRVGPNDLWWWMTMHQQKETRLNLQKCAPSKSELAPSNTDCGCWSMQGDQLQKWVTKSCDNRYDEVCVWNSIQDMASCLIFNPFCVNFDLVLAYRHLGHWMRLIGLYLGSKYKVCR